MTDSQKTHSAGALETSVTAMQSTLGASLAAACFAGTFAAGAQAQEAPILLPTVEVETTAIPTASATPSRPARAAAPQVCTPELAGTPVCAAQEAEEARLQAEAAARAFAEAKANAGSSQFADPNAPFKANALSNSRLQGDPQGISRTVTAITQEVLETTGTTSVREIARSTPGMSLGFGEGGNAFGDNIYIRGFKANNDIYKDGIRDPGISVSETFNTEQVEIVKGPAGTLGGRGTTGGAIDIVSKSPQDIDFTRSITEVTSAGTVRQTLDVNRTIGDRTQLRFNGLLQDGAVAGRDEVYDDRQGLAFAVKHKVNDALTLEADYSKTMISQMPDWGVPSLGDDGGPVTEYGVDRDTFYGVVGRDYQDVEQQLATAKASYEFGNGMVLTNTLRKARSVNDYVLTAPSSFYDNDSDDIADWETGLSFKSRYQVTDVLANVTEFSGSAALGGLTHDFVIGLSYNREEVETRGYSGLTSEDYEAPDGRRGCIVSVVDPDPIAAGCWSGEAPVLGDRSTQTDVKTTSVYLQDSVALSERLTVNGGLRVDRYEISRDGFSWGGDPYSYARTDTMFNWNLGASYAWSDALNLYAAVATSTNPMGQEIAAGGGFYGGLDDAGQLLDPETNTSIELGAKYAIHDDLLFTAALFQTTKDNARETQGRGADAVTTSELKYRMRGIELGIAGQITDRLAVFGGATLMDSEVLNSVNPDNIGASISNVAHNQFSLLATYDVTENWMVGARTTYTGGRDLGSGIANGNTLPDAFVVDFMTEFDLSDTTTLKAGVTNAFDETVYDAAYRSGTPFTYVAPGREISLSLEMKF